MLFFEGLNQQFDASFAILCIDQCGKFIFHHLFEVRHLATGAKLSGHASKWSHFLLQILLLSLKLWSENHICRDKKLMNHCQLVPLTLSDLRFKGLLEL